MFSSYKPCEVGVPQGSILGPLIFLIYIYDLSYELDCQCEQYADDTTMSASSQSNEETARVLTNNCEKVSQWMSQNQLKLNPDKTHKMTVGTSHRLKSQDANICVTMDGFTLQESIEKSETILGVTVQSNLKWNTHVSDVRNKLKKRIAGIYKIRHVVPFQTLKTISEGWVNSVLVYCLPLFGGCELSDLKDLQVIQNKVAGMVTSS